jgi:hypothetical protein
MMMILDFYGLLREHHCGICGLAAQRNRAQGDQGAEVNFGAQPGGAALYEAGMTCHR